jgi:hypothetical protein
MDSLKATDAASAAVAGKPGNRVSLADIEANILAEQYCRGTRLLSDVGKMTHDDHEAAKKHVSVLTVCLLVLRNGFTIIGKSAPADPENYNEELGRKFAREDAIRQVWPLMGYAKREALAAA